MEEKQRSADVERIRARIMLLIEREFESDAAFERAFSLCDKTVSNWRRGRSSSFMRMLPELSQSFGINVGELLDMPLKKNTSELSEDELKLLNAYRKTASLPPRMRAALFETLEGVMRLYTESLPEEKSTGRQRKRKGGAEALPSGDKNE